MVKKSQNAHRKMIFFAKKICELSANFGVQIFIPAIFTPNSLVKCVLKIRELQKGNQSEIIYQTWDRRVICVSVLFDSQ